MKTCAYCGEENQAGAIRCYACGTEFLAGETADPGLTDPATSLCIVATFGDVTEASLLRDRLSRAGIEACIPEELDPNPFGNLTPMAHVTVRVARKDYDAAKALLAGES
jgi:hypothetical protein